MFSYQFYKLMHLFSIFAFSACLGMSFILPSDKVPKKVRVSIGVFGFFMLVGGFGLLARIGGQFEGWVIAKTIMWAILVAGASIGIKRLKTGREYFLLAGLLIMFTSAYLAINKPF